MRVYPVAGVYGLEGSACDPTPAPGMPAQAQVFEAFCSALAPSRLGARFRQLAGAAFPGAVTDIATQVGSGETAQAALSKTVIATLHVSRADLWIVEKPAVNDVYVPITLSLLLTNALSGEVIFVENNSTIVQGTLGKATYQAQVSSQFPEQLDAALRTVVASAAERFKPYALSGRVRARAGDRYVFDLGRKGGIREGDLIGPDARVVFSDADYSIIEPLLGSLSVGQTLTRQVAQPVEVLEKPSALVVVAKAPDGVSRAYLNTLFEDAIGQGAGLAVAPVNPSFTGLRRLALGEARLSSDYGSRRAIPDYFIRLSVAALEPLDLETNLENAHRQIVEARAFVEVIDHAGRVVYATRGANRITDQVLHGIGFSPEQRRDTAIKNAIVDAAAALSKGFRPAKLRLEVRPVGDEVEIADPGGALALGAHAVLLRKLGSAPDIASEVWTPVGSLQVSAVSADGVRARSADPTPLKAHTGDRAAFESVAGPVASRRQFTPCAKPGGSVSVSQRGAVAMPMFEPIALNSFAAAFPAPVRLPDFNEELRPYIADFAGVDALPLLQPAAPDVCFEPVYQVDLQGEKTAGGFVTPTYSLAMGYVLRRNGEKVASAALQQSLTATATPSSAAPAARANALQYDLVAAASQLTLQALKGVKPPP